MQKRCPFAAVVLVAAALAVAALAVPPSAALAGSHTVRIDNPIAADDFKDIVVRIANWAVAIAAPVVSLVVIWAGYLYLTGGGKPEQIKKATQALTWAVIGFIVVLIARGAAELIKNVTGLKG